MTEFLLNELSVHGQFSDAGVFRQAIERVMLIREALRRFGRELHCGRQLVSMRVTSDQYVPQVVGRWSADEQRALMQWITRGGPFWDDTRAHSSDEFLTYNDELVTDNAVGEAAYCCYCGLQRAVVSVVPSTWQVTPLMIAYHQGVGGERTIAVANHWEKSTVEKTLADVPVPGQTWDELGLYVKQRFPELTFSDDAFTPLRPHPFVASAAERIVVLCGVLATMRRAFGPDGARTEEGHRLYAAYFTGDRALFSDSSASEKQHFASELTFSRPGGGEALQCTWHGKVRSPQLRIHFSWPITCVAPLYVVYVGPKLTKR